VNGAVYAMQPFAVGVKAFGQARGGKAVPLSLFQNATGPAGANRAIGLSAVARPDGTASPAGGPFTVSTAKPLPVDPAMTDFPDMVASATYKLGATYSSATAATRGATSTWVAPALIYVRAAMTERILSGSTAAPTTTNVTVDSRVPSAAAAGTRYEDGLYVMSGRVLVPNVFGTDLLRLPVPLVAQYWNGSFWATSDGDIDSTVAVAIVPIAGSCRRYFTTDPKTGACKASPLVADPTRPLPLRIKAGKASLLLTAPARGTIGSVDFKVDNGTANAWLPSTIGRATFGLFRSPLIYLREVY
jgi:MSHA biogenesis protein MshQ